MKYIMNLIPHYSLHLRNTTGSVGYSGVAKTWMAQGEDDVSGIPAPKTQIAKYSGVSEGREEVTGSSVGPQARDYQRRTMRPDTIAANIKLNMA